MTHPIAHRNNAARTKVNIQPGDILYVNRGIYKHYGVYTGDGKVIHFAPLAGTEINAENAVIHETTLKNFLKDGTLSIDKKIKAITSRRKIVERARSQIGKKSYNLAFNNCEHFAHWCKTGVCESNQVHSVIDIVVEGVAYTAELINGSDNPKHGKRLLSKLTNYLR